MAFSYTIDGRGRHALLIGTGHVTGRECADAVRRLASDPAFGSDFTVLADIRSIVYEPGRQHEVMEVARTLFLLSSRFRNRIAIVAEGALLLTVQVFAALVSRTQTIALKVFVDSVSAESYCRDGHRYRRTASA